MSADRPSAWRRAAAWAVHGLTATGAVCCLFALGAAAAHRWQTMFAWLAAAVVIDAIDGTFARAVDVKRVVPSFDGTLLDAIIDYAGYVLVPAFALGQSALLPHAWSWPAASCICLASAYQFCQVDAKTDDHFFLGFPSYWNILLFYLFLWHLPPVANLVLVAFAVVLVFVPIKYIYPSRTPFLRPLTLTLSGIWTVSIAAMLWYFPDPPRWLMTTSLLFVAYYAGLSLYLNGRSGGAHPNARRG